MELITSALILIGLAAFLLGWGVGLLSFLFGVYESISTSHFKPKVFQFGKLVLNRKMQITFNSDQTPIDQVIKTENTKFKFIEQDICLFRKHKDLFKIDFHTPFPLKGKMLLQPDSIEIEGRLPIGPTVFLLAWFIGWTGGGLMFLGAEPNDYFQVIGFFLPGWIAVGLFMLCIPYEIRRSNEAVNEIIGYLSSYRSGN